MHKNALFFEIPVI